MIIGPLLCGFVTISIFCVWEWKCAKLPIIPSRLYRAFNVNCNLTYNHRCSAYIQTQHSDRRLHHHVSEVSISISHRSLPCSPVLGSGMIFFSALYYLPQFFQVALAFSPIRSGLFLLPVLVSQTSASFIAVCIMFYIRYNCFICPDFLYRDRS